MAQIWPTLASAIKDQKLDHADAVSDYELFSQVYDGLETQADPDNVLETDIEAVSSDLGTIAEADDVYATATSSGLGSGIFDDLGSSIGTVQGDCQAASVSADS